jgi:hypothetical protein
VSQCSKVLWLVLGSMGPLSIKLSSTLALQGHSCLSLEERTKPELFVMAGRGQAVGGCFFIHSFFNQKKFFFSTRV